MKSELRPRAVMRIEGGFAHICAWCADKPAADVWAAEQGLRPSHGICQACMPQLASDVIFEAGERCGAPDAAESAERGTASAAPSRLVAFSCRLGGATP